MTETERKKVHAKLIYHAGICALVAGGTHDERAKAASGVLNESYALRSDTHDTIRRLYATLASAVLLPDGKRCLEVCKIVREHLHAYNGGSALQ